MKKQRTTSKLAVWLLATAFICIISSQPALSIKKSCAICGQRCIYACGTDAFRPCCLSYNRKRAMSILVDDFPEESKLMEMMGKQSDPMMGSTNLNLNLNPNPNPTRKWKGNAVAINLVRQMLSAPMHLPLTAPDEHTGGTASISAY